MDNIEDIHKAHKKKPTTHKRKRLIAVILIIALVAALVLFSFFQFNLYEKFTGNADTKLTQTDLIKKVNELNNDSKSNEAKKLIEIQTQVSYEDNAEVAVVYAQTLAANGDGDRAVEILDGLRKNAPSSKAYDYAGKAAYILQVDGQKDKAIEYYKQALSLAQALNPTTDDEKLTVGSAIADYYWYLGQLEIENE